jgi:dihydroflavonol-4-reductase
MNNPSSTKVLVTGAGGFVGLHTMVQFLQQGYSVRGTVRTESHAQRVKEALSKHISTDKLELVLADLLIDEGWSEAVNGCEYVLHVASPFPAEDPKDENELIIPARDGVMRILHAAHAEGVKRIVLVSSTAAIVGDHVGENMTFSNSDWTDLEKCRSAYQKSKTIAEQSAWDFINGPENTNKMEMASVNPTNIFGPVLDDHHHTSTEWFRTLLRAEIPGVARNQLDLVDVRDVVDALLSAMTLPQASRNRFLLNGASISIPELADILHRNFASQGYRVPTRVMPDFLVRLFAIFVPKTRPVARSLGWKYNLSTEHTRSTLNWQPRPYEKSILDMANSLIEMDMLK